MCILPSFEAEDLKTLKRKEKRKNRKAETETVELFVPEQLEKTL
jgi:hypothetical protein